MRFRLWYVDVFVTDLERAVEFYASTLGLPLRLREDEFGYASFGTEGAGLALARVDAESGAEPGPRHTGIGLGVADIHAAYRELRGKGVEFTMPPTKQRGILAMFRDPDGNALYLDQLREE